MLNSPAHLLAIPTLLVSRRPPGSVDPNSARSWLGGLPRLGALNWPQTEDGRAMLHAAQIDLAEVAEASSEAPLPKNGSLAFFIGGTGAVLFVPNHMTHSPTALPSNTVDLGEVGTQRWQGNEEGLPIFPLSPIELTKLTIPVPPPIPDWWQIAIQYAQNRIKDVGDLSALYSKRLDELDAARKKLKAERANPTIEVVLANAEENVAYFERLVAAFEVSAKSSIFRRLSASLGASAKSPETAFRDFADTLVAWTQDRDPWAIMSTDEVAEFEALARSGRQFKDFMYFYADWEFDGIKEEMFEALPKPGDDAFGSLPESVRDILVVDRTPREKAEAAAIAKLVPQPLLAGDKWHQMFGHGVTVQTAASDFWDEGVHLLLQLNNDPALHWDFGDNGAFQFWISPADLAARNWSAVLIGSECH